MHDSAASLAGALRSVLWYAVHSDLLVCPLALLGGADVGPDRALVFVDAYLSGAWLHARPPDPPLPNEPHGADSARAPMALDDHAPLPFTESTAVFKQSPSQDPPGLEDQPPLESVGDELTAPADVLGPDGRAHLAAAYHDHDALDADDTYSRSLHPRLHGDQYTIPGRALPEVLPPDALFFLDESGAPWPCNARQLSAARAVLIVRTPAPGADARQSAAARAWIERVERGFAELRQRLSP